MIGECLLSLAFSDEIIVVDSGSIDSTVEIAKSAGAKIVMCREDSYAQRRNVGLKAARGDWILYVDADERITPLLKKEIEQIMSSSDSASVYQLPRKNVYLGKEMHFGGWGNDQVIRLFKKSALQKYEGDLHEQPVFTGELRTTSHELIHYSHRDLASMLDKTLLFTAHEARLRLAANHPRMSWWRFLRVMFTEFWLRFIKFSAWRDGVEGVIDGIFQVFNMFVIYSRLWELQNENRSRI